LFNISIFNKKVVSADNAEVEDPTANPDYSQSYSPTDNLPYQYFGPPEATHQPIRRPPPIRRQTEFLTSALEPVTSFLGPDAGVSCTFHNSFTEKFFQICIFIYLYMYLYTTFAFFLVDRWRTRISNWIS
jgi:hypothetical protein